MNKTSKTSKRKHSGNTGDSGNAAGARGAGAADRTVGLFGGANAAGGGRNSALTGAASGTGIQNSPEGPEGPDGAGSAERAGFADFGGGFVGSSAGDGGGFEGSAGAGNERPARLITAGDLGFASDEARIESVSYGGVVSMSDGASGFAGIDGLGYEPADGGGSPAGGTAVAADSSAAAARAGNWLARNKFALISYAGAAAIVLLAYIVNGIYPFGTRTIIKSDMAHSYVPTMIELRRILFEDRSFVFSWNGGLGLNFIHNLSQMAVSPFVLITFLFPIKDVTEGIALLILLKIPFAAVTLNLYMRNRFKLKDAALVVLSIMYALSAYVTANHFNTMWFDGVILLPLIAMGIERLVKERKSLMYMLALGAAIFTNYLIGFYLCGFSLLYFIANLFFRKQWGDKKALKSSCLLFFSRSLIAAGLTAFFVLPIALSLQGTGYINANAPAGFKLNFSVLRLALSHFWGITPSILTFSNVSGPNVYCGVLTLVLLPLFYFNRNIKIKEKLVLSGMCLFIIAGFIINLVDYVYNGFRLTSMFPHRFSFLYSFLLIIMAARAFMNLDKKRINVLFAVVPAFAAIMAASFWLYPQKIDRDEAFTPILEIMPGVQKPGTIGIDVLIVNISLILLLSALVFAYVKLRDNRPVLARIMVIAMATVTVAEISSSAVRNMGVMKELERDKYIEYYDDMQAVSSFLADEPEFYRATFKHNLSLSEARLYNYKDISTFSAIQASATTLGDRIGLMSTLNSMLLINPTPFLSSIFSIKYLMDKTKALPKSFTIYDYKWNSGSVYVHENPYALPVGFLVNEDAVQWDIMASQNVYEVQNDFARKASGIGADVMLPIEIESLDYEFLEMEPKMKPNAAPDAEPEQEFQQWILDIKEDPASGNIPKITLYFTAGKEGYMNVHVRTGGATRGQVYVNDAYILNQMAGNLHAILDAGYVHVGDKIKIILSMDRKRLDSDDMDVYVPNPEFWVTAAVMDQATFERVVEKFKQSALKVSYYDDTTIQGTISADRDGILFTSVPDDGNWIITVDGKEREGMKIGTALAAVRLDAGEHTVELKYQLKGVWIGALVSLASLLAVLLLFLLPFLGRRLGFALPKFLARPDGGEPLLGASALPNGGQADGWKADGGQADGGRGGGSAAFQAAEGPPRKPARAPAAEPAQAPAVGPALAPAVGSALAPTVMPAPEPTVLLAREPVAQPAQSPVAEPPQAPAAKPAAASAAIPSRAPIAGPGEWFDAAGRLHRANGRLVPPGEYQYAGGAGFGDGDDDDDDDSEGGVAGEG
ncbi:MAG: YfhO family protein, partial [Clostridiales bacterium]|nr:YfhO family protein [Clostridiales bacterium]